QRLVGVLETIATPKAAHIALAAWPRLSPQGRRTTHDLLRHLGARALPVLRTLVKRDDPRGIVAAKLLGNLRSPEAQAALLAVAGQGPDIKRAAVATSLIRLGEKRALAKTLEALMKTASKYLPRRADLVLAAARLARDAPNSVRAKTAVRLSLLWPKIGKDRSFELRYRLLQAVGSLDARGQKAWIIAHSRGHDPILRWQALIHLAQVTDTTTTGRLLEALKDRDPRIRASAARSLGQRKAPPIIKALATILRYEAWPFVARAAATALGRHCSPATEKALRRAIRYRALGIDVSALSALARCRPHNLFDTLVTLTMNRHQPVTLRSRAAALIDRKLAAGHTAIIASLFLRLRKNALGSARAERVAATLAETLGRIGGGDAAGRPLRDALALDASVPI
ncbi:MAG: HEAT repeat domain-containing protein, partial [Deltaproteobacteria bacterium]|nr:HEAT repeat domain-containing protein [Deltaproteobacteria bacterium]